MNNSLTYYEWLKYMKEKQNTIVSGRFYSKTILERLAHEDAVEYAKDNEKYKEQQRTGILSGKLNQLKLKKK